MIRLKLVVDPLSCYLSFYHRIRFHFFKKRKEAIVKQLPFKIVFLTCTKYIYTPYTPQPPAGKKHILF